MTALSTTSLSSAGEAALETLVSCLPADLSRVAKLREVHAACSAAGVVDARSATAETSAGDDDDGAGDVARLHSLFDAAVRHGVSSLVCHYVDEVCGRDDFSSPDGVEAYLRDGEMVAEWAVAATRRAEAVLASASASAASNVPSAADAADAAAAVFEATRDVLGLLGARPDAAGEPEPLEQHRGAGRAGGADGATDAASMRRKLQISFDDASRGGAHATALAWLVREGLGGATTPDRHGGPAAWTGAVRARRAAAAAASADGSETSDGPSGTGVVSGIPALDDGALFLDDLLHGAGEHPPPYPFKSATEAAARVFGGGSARPDALVAKRCLFLYYLLDAGAPAEGAPASFARSARLSPRLFAQTVAAAALDDWDSQTALDEARALVPKMARKDLPAKFVAALVARGAPAAALAAARARGPPAFDAFDDDVTRHDGSRPPSSSAFVAFAQEADLGVTVRLECGLATEAFLAASAATAAAPPERRDEIAGALAARLASHAASKDALGTILELPFEGALERALCLWLRENCGRAPGAPAHYGVQYFLLRGRAAEAAAEAAATAPPLPAETRDSLNAAIAALPEPLKRLRLDGAAAAALADGGARALARGLETGTASPAEIAATAAGAAAGAAASGGGFGSFEPGAGTLAVLDGPGPFAGGHPGGTGPAVGGRPPFFAPPRLTSGETQNIAEVYPRGDARGALSSAAEKKTPAGSAGAGASFSPRGADDAWTRLRFDGARARAVGLMDEDEEMSDEAHENENENANANENQNQKRDAIGDAEDAEVGDEQTLPARREAFVAAARATPVPKRAAASPFGRKAGAGAVAPAPRLAPADARGISGTPATLAARAGGRWAPPPAFGASSAPAKIKAAAESLRRSPRSSGRPAEVVAMDASGALLAGVSPVASQRGARSSASRRAPASLFAGTTPSGAGGDQARATRRATRSSSRLAGE